MILLLEGPAVSSLAVCFSFEELAELCPRKKASIFFFKFLSFKILSLKFVVYFSRTQYGEHVLQLSRHCRVAGDLNSIPVSTMPTSMTCVTESHGEKRIT